MDHFFRTHLSTISYHLFIVWQRHKDINIGLSFLQPAISVFWDNGVIRFVIAEIVPKDIQAHL